MATIPKDITDKLLSYQIEHATSILNSLQKYSRALDTSDTGTGKTYSSCAISKALKLKPLIICPKSVIADWVKVLKYFDCPYYGISNYELIKNCRYYPHNKIKEKSSCCFISRKEKVKTSKEILRDEKRLKEGKKIKKEYIYKWKLPKDMIIIFDEVHRCKNKESQNSDIIISACNYDIKILMLSATACDRPGKFVIAGYVLGLYPSMKHGLNWINSVSKGHQNPMVGVHERIFPEHASRMKIRDIGALFPENKTYAECFDMENAKEIEEQYKIIEDEVNRVRKLKIQSRGWGKIIRARMEIEMLKCPTFIKLSKEFLEKGYSVIIFVNFTNTLLTIADELNTNCLVYGEQTIEQRNKNISDFKNDKSRIIVCNSASGGVGISLHDTIGKYPRVTLIMPSWSAQDLLQSLGRAHRAGGKTPVLQKIIYCKNTIEEGICENIKEKIQNIASLNDASLEGYQIEGLIEGGENDMYKELTEFERLFQRINVLHAKRDRLKKELIDTEAEIKEFEKKLYSSIN